MAAVQGGKTRRVDRLSSLISVLRSGCSLFGLILIWDSRRMNYHVLIFWVQMSPMTYTYRQYEAPL